MNTLSFYDRHYQNAEWGRELWLAALLYAMSDKAHRLKAIAMSLNIGSSPPLDEICDGFWTTPGVAYVCLCRLETA